MRIFGCHWLSCFLAVFHILNNIEISNKNGIYSLIYQLLLTSNSNANFIQVDIGFFKKIPTNITTLWQSVPKTAMTTRLEDVDLVKDNLNNNYFQTTIIHLNNKSIFLLSVNKNVNTLLQPQKLQQLYIKLDMF